MPVRVASDVPRARVVAPARAWRPAGAADAGSEGVKLLVATVVGAWVAVVQIVPAVPRDQADAREPVAAADRGALVRVGGDVVVDRGGRYDSVVAVGGDARVAGAAEHVVVIGGLAELDGARVGDLVVVNGRAVLRDRAAVTGDIDLVGSTIERDPSVTVGGEVRTRRPWHVFGFWITGVLLPLGVLLALVLAGLAVAALIPGGVRRAEAALTRSPGKTVLAALLLWIVVPAVVVLSFVAVVTIPAGIGVLVFVLPALAFFGYVIVGIRIGEALIGRVLRRAEPAPPYLAPLVGIPLLALLGRLPYFGGLITVVSAIVGGGAILLAVWRALRGDRAEPPPSAELAGPAAPQGA